MPLLYTIEFYQVFYKSIKINFEIQKSSTGIHCTLQILEERNNHYGLKLSTWDKAHSN